MKQRITLEAFPPGEYIREELEARGWTQADLAAILGRSANNVGDIIAGTLSITPETAQALADAFGTSAQLWMNLDSSYQLVKAASRGKDETIARRARLYEIAPVREMQKRAWIERTSNIDVLETQICQFFEIATLDEPISLKHAARKSTDYTEATGGQLAWLYRAKHLAEALSVEAKFSNRTFDLALDKLNRLKGDAEELRHIPKVLAQCGIRFLIVEHLPHTKIDGACFWLDSSSPVIAISMRYDRIDWFWHTLMHEMGHVKSRDGQTEPTLDTSLVGSDAQAFDEKPAQEIKADQFAANFLVDQKELEGFINRVHPLYYSLDIARFAKRLGVHPGLVVGQLHYRRKIAWTHGSKMLIKVRDLVIAVALTDGWGHTVSI